MYIISLIIYLLENNRENYRKDERTQLDAILILWIDDLI
jgi:hypothetical protein